MVARGSLGAGDEVNLRDVGEAGSWAGLERQDVPEGCPQDWCGGGGRACSAPGAEEVPLSPFRAGVRRAGVCEVGQK